MPKSNHILVAVAVSLFVLAGVIISFYGFVSAPPPDAMPQFRHVTPPAPPADPHADLIKVTSPMPKDVVTSPLTVSGSARGSWYFEASFPVQLLDAQGNVLASTPAQAQGDWMTNDFVPFTATLNFTATPGTTGTLVLKKDNPSGDPAHDDEISIPVTFGAPAVQAACKTSGCSNEICSDQNVVTNCVYRAEYACYKTAKCERQSDGQCGWTETPKLKACLKAYIGVSPSLQ